MLPVRSKPRPFDLIVRAVIREAADAVTVVFDPVGELPAYQAGQFLTIDPRQFRALAGHLAFLEHLKGRRELVRAYSMTSAPHEPPAITIKEETFIPQVSLHAALLSPLLVYGISSGTKISAVGFTGPYTLPPDIEARTDHLVHIVAGSGAVPNFSILKHALRERPRLRHTFLSSNKVWDDVLFREPLQLLAAQHPARLRLVHTLTRTSEVSGLSGEVRSGRIGPGLLAELIPDSQTAYAYVCGPAINPWDRRAALEARVTAPPKFLESTLAALKELGFTHERLKHESYG